MHQYTFIYQKAKHNDNEFVIEVALNWFKVKITPAGESTEELQSFGKNFNLHFSADLIIILFL